MGTLTFILGGARSGKSRYALQAVKTLQQPVTFIATATAGDDEMRERIANHQAERPADWQTVEAPTQIAKQLANLEKLHPVVILDCITLLASNILMMFDDPENVEISAYLRAIDEEIKPLMQYIQTSEADWYVISNEVGLGLVPPYKMGRDYRDGLGRANQHIAAQADRVILMVAGIPMVVK